MLKLFILIKIPKLHKFECLSQQKKQKNNMFFDMTQIQIKGGRWLPRRDILDVLGKRGKVLLKAFTDKYLNFKGKITTEMKKKYSMEVFYAVL